MDERLTSYVRERWPDLVQDAARRCDDADSRTSQELALSALIRVAARWRFAGNRDDPDPRVRRALARACRAHERARPPQSPIDFQLMEVGVAGVRVDESAETVVVEPAILGVDEVLAILTRRVRQVRQRRALTASVAAVVVVVIAVSALGSSGSGSGSTAKLHHHARKAAPVTEAVFPKRLIDFASGVTAGGGFIWTIESRATRSGSISYIVERNPVTGAVESRYRVPQPDDHISYGLGKVWAWHNQADFHYTAIATVDRLGQLSTLRTSPSVAIDDVAFTRDFAWLTEPTANQVTAMHNNVLSLGEGSTVVGARFVIPLSATSVLVAGRSGTMRVLPSGQFVYLGVRGLSLLASAPSYGIWIARGPVLTYQTRIDEPPSVTLRLPLDVASVTGDPAQGVYVALRSNNPFHYDPYLVYYSPAALRSRHPVPTARLDGLLQAEGMTADPAGGVVFVTNNGAIDEWNPLGLTSRRLLARDQQSALG